MKQFEQGQTYTTRSLCDHDCIYTITVAKRTTKTITTSEGQLLRVGVYQDAEYVMPKGRYSMAPTIRAGSTELNTCDDCKAQVDHIIGCPDGAEVCQACFDAGNH